jgi:hypothetical protein
MSPGSRLSLPLAGPLPLQFLKIGDTAPGFVFLSHGAQVLWTSLLPLFLPSYPPDSAWPIPAISVPRANMESLNCIWPSSCIPTSFSKQLVDTDSCQTQCWAQGRTGHGLCPPGSHSAEGGQALPRNTQSHLSF